MKDWNGGKPAFNFDISRKMREVLLLLKATIQRLSFDFNKLHKLALLGLSLIGIFISPALNMQNTLAAKTAYQTNIKSIAYMDSTELFSGLALKNTGLGPVVIKAVEIHDKHGKKVSNDSYNVSSHFASILKNRFSVQSIKPGDSLLPDKEYILLESRVNTPEEAIIVRDFLYNMNMSVCYCAFDYSKCQTKSIGLKSYATKTKSC